MTDQPQNLTHPAAITPEPWRDREGYLSCSYCGSMEPRQLLEAFRTGKVAHWSGSDWKYGYPHKFYLGLDSGKPSETFYGLYLQKGAEFPDRPIEFIPHFPEAYYASEEEYRTALARRESTIVGRKDGTGNITAKFYTAHLEDVVGDSEVFTSLAAELESRLGIHFELKDGGIVYSAPYRGYQTWGDSTAHDARP